MLDITNTILFDSLMEVQVDGQYVDLHNEYACIDIKYLNTDNRIDFLFKRHDNDTAVIVQFKEVTIELFNLKFSTNRENATLDQFYRGRFVDNGVLKDHSETKGNYFYINFFEDTALELFAKQVILIKEK